MNPLPDIDNAYSMVLQCEKQKKIQHNFSDAYDSSALIGRGQCSRNLEGDDNPVMLTRDIKGMVTDMKRMTKGEETK